MSSLVYKIANPLYKGLSAIVVLYICYTLLFKWKEITADRKFLSLFGLLAGSHLLSAVFNRSGHLSGNVIEILFMVTYVLLFTIDVYKRQALSLPVPMLPMFPARNLQNKLIKVLQEEGIRS